MRRTVAVDFETKPIEPRPDYPPEPVGVAIKDGRRTARYLCWGHPSGNNCARDDARRILESVWKDPDATLVFHNAKFDLDVAERWFGLKPPPAGRLEDTMLAGFLADPYARSLELKPMAERILGRAPIEQTALRQWILEHVSKASDAAWGRHIASAPADVVADYACADVEVLAPLLERLKKNCPEEPYRREIRLIAELLEVERRGMTVDLHRLEKDCDAYQSTLERVDAWIRSRLKSPELNIDERDKVADAMERAGLVQEWLRTPKGRRSTKKGALEQVCSDRLLVAALSYRGSLATCLRTFMLPWRGTALRSGGVVFTQWRSTKNEEAGARTGRLSSSPNLQNIPTDFEKMMPLLEGAKLFEQIPGLPPLPLVRSYVVADSKEHLLCGRDYDGQELRMLAHFEDGMLAQMYREQPEIDLHQFIADQLNQRFGLSITRKWAKTLNFLKIYGGGTPKLAATLGIPLAEAEQIMSAYMMMLPGLREMNDDMKRRGRAGQPIRTWGGRYYYAEPPKMVDGGIRSYEYKLLNYLIQGSCADMTKEAWLRYAELRKDSRMVLTVHDELVICAPKKAWRREMKALRTAMESIELDVPVLSDGEYGYRWTEMKETE